MIQYETRLQTPGRSRKASFIKKDILKGIEQQVFVLDGDRFVLRQVEKVVYHGKHDLIFISIGSSSSLQCREDTRLKTPDGWATVADLSVGDEIVGVRHVFQRPRAGERGKFLELEDGVDALARATPVTEKRKSHIMWSGRRNDVMRVYMKDSDNFVTSTGLVVYGGTDD